MDGNERMNLCITIGRMFPLSCHKSNRKENPGGCEKNKLFMLTSMSARDLQLTSLGGVGFYVSGPSLPFLPSTRSIVRHIVLQPIDTDEGTAWYDTVPPNGACT